MGSAPQTAPASTVVETPKDQSLGWTLPDLQTAARATTETVVGLLGFAYICGFLVVYTFLNRFGIHDSSTEFFRARYVHTGILCLAFPIFVMGPIGAHLWMYVRQRSFQDDYNRLKSEGNAVGRTRLPYTLQLLCAGTCLYLFVLFEPYGELHSQLGWIAALLFFAVWPMVLWRKGLGFAAAEEHAVIRWSLALICFALLLIALRNSWHLLAKVGWQGFSYWLFTSSLAAFTVQFTTSRIVFWYPGQRLAAQLARSGITVTLAILSILAFAYRLYPLVPANKGGGDYHYSRSARICALPDKTQLPESVTSGSTTAGCTAAVKLLEITDSTIYFARADDRGTDDNGKSAQDTKDDPRSAAEIWSDGRFFPTVYAMPRSNVSVIQFDGSKASDSLGNQ